MEQDKQRIITICERGVAIELQQFFARNAPELNTYYFRSSEVVFGYRGICTGLLPHETALRLKDQILSDKLFATKVSLSFQSESDAILYGDNFGQKDSFLKQLETVLLPFGQISNNRQIKVPIPLSQHIGVQTVSYVPRDRIRRCHEDFSQQNNRHFLNGLNQYDDQIFHTEYVPREVLFYKSLFKQQEQPKEKYNQNVRFAAFVSFCCTIENMVVSLQQYGFKPQSYEVQIIDGLEILLMKGDIFIGSLNDLDQVISVDGGPVYYCFSRWKYKQFVQSILKQIIKGDANIADISQLNRI